MIQTVSRDNSTARRTLTACQQQQGCLLRLGTNHGTGLPMSMAHTINSTPLTAQGLSAAHCNLWRLGYATSTARAVENAGAFCACAPTTRSCSLAWPCRKRPVTCTAASTLLSAVFSSALRCHI